MKNLCIAMLAAILFSACDNELDVAAPWKDIPIIYGILSPQDTAHYIRIEKAFLDPETSAEQIARIADSLYYDEIEATIIDGAGRRYGLVRVDGNLEGYIRDEGVFAESPNVLYKVADDDFALRSGETYSIEVRRSEMLPLVTASTVQVGPPNINRPRTGSELRFPYDNDFRVVWREAASAFFYDASLVINYEEGIADDPESFVEKQLEWKLVRNTTEFEVEVPGIQFFEFLADQIEVDPTLVREMGEIRCFVRSGGRELFEFRTIQLANSGFTSIGGDIPEYTNISEGLGVLTTSNRDLETMLTLDDRSRDSLIEGSITRNLNFQ